MIKSKKLKRFKSITHCFFNSNGGVSSNIYESLNCGIGSKDLKKNVRDNIKIVSKKINIKKNRLIFLRQIHSNKIFEVKSIEKKRIIGDGLVTKEKNIALCILTADCVPVFLFDHKIKMIGAIHAGWRGAYKNICKRAVKIFKKIKSNVKDVIAVIGPCIDQKNYEVKKNFKKKFLNINKKNNKFFKEKSKKIFFDLGGFIKNQLLSLGIGNIEWIKKDTFNNKNNFFSARKALQNNYNDYGRNISLIMIK